MTVILIGNIEKKMNRVDAFRIYAIAACCLIGNFFDLSSLYFLGVGICLGGLLTSIQKIYKYEKELEKKENPPFPWNPFPTVWIDEQSVKNEYVEVIIQSDPYRRYLARISQQDIPDHNVIFFDLRSIYKQFIYEKNIPMSKEFDQIIAWRKVSESFARGYDEIVNGNRGV